MMHVRPLSPIVALVALTACGLEPTAPERLAGTWGGEHVRITVQSADTEFEFDCAHGTASGTLKPDRSGRFSVEGFFVREGGPDTETSERDREPATYSGRVQGQSLNLSVSVAGVALGPFNAVQDRPPSLFKCR